MENKIIGIIQHITLPDHSDDDIVAKIDTGAYRSSVWASSITEKDGELSYVLFAPDSPYYSGKVLKTRDYKLIKVKNSFGKIESRYRVHMNIRIDGKLYRTTFSLSNRSRNRYSVLIGRRLLHNRYIVDVSKKHHLKSGVNSDKLNQVVVLTSRLDRKTRDFFEIVSKNVSAEIILENYKNLQFAINEDGAPSILLPNGSDIADSKLVYFKAYSLYQEHAIAIADYLKFKHVPFVDAELNHSMSRSKLSEIFRLSINDIPVPKTIIVTYQDAIPDYSDLVNYFGGSFVVKDVAADRGKNNYLVVDEAAFDEALRRLYEVKTIMIQKFIDNDGFYRVLRMGNRVVQIVRRDTADHKDSLRAHLNKPFGGKNASELNKHECDSEMLEIAKRASNVMHRNVAGVDLIQDKTTKKWYVLEVNYNPEVLGGLSPTRKAEGLAKFLESKSN